MDRHRAWLAALLGAACAGTGACSAVLDLQAPPPEQAIAFDGSFPLPDATFEGGPLPEAASDGRTDGSLDAGADAEAAAACSSIDADLPDGPLPTSWSPFTDFHRDDAGDTSWETFDLTPFGAHAQQYFGGAFDGHYVYYVPDSYGLVMRYDTSRPFTSAPAWSTFDTSGLASAAQGFAGCVYDGRYLYLIPHSGGGYGGLVVRFDTKGAAFDAGAAWSTFDTTTVPVPGGGESARGFYGGTYDGRYAYLVPYYDGTNRVGRVARYDTLAEGGVPEAGRDGAVDASSDAATDASDAGAPLPTFGSASDWETFDLTSLDQSAAGFVGAAFDGRNVYLVPYENTAGSSGIVARFDTTRPLASGWQFFDLSNTVDPDGIGFIGAAFDGQYLYLVPHTKTKVARYDVKGSFTSKSSWTTFDLAGVGQLDGGNDHLFSGAAFDGRFVYFMPQAGGAVVRYDSLSPFDSTCAWSVYDTAAHVLPGANDFVGAVYDGRFVYLVPHHTLAVRFDTKTPGWAPAWPLTGGSFF